MFHLVTGALGLFVSAHLWPLLPASRFLRIVCCLGVLLISQHHLLTRLTFGTMFSAEVPRAVLIWVNVLFAAIVFAAVMFVVLDLLRLVASLVRLTWTLLPKTAGRSVIVVALALAGFGVNSAISQPPVRRVDLAIADLPESFEGYRIVQLTDLHLSRLFRAPWTEELVRRTNAL
ncbi:hypothetical protein [Thioclava sp. SK-1]|uniref:hypothetical protein n=1 Tax=Thioclava sp. SK-1 TaxID=1889770 RepID=UPI001C4003DC|nr:hypothetical protein [Thioclava sp. SK-1]